MLVGCAVVAAIGNVEWSYRNSHLLLVSPPLHTPPAFGPCPPNDVFYVLLLLPRQQLHNSKCFVRPRIDTCIASRPLETPPAPGVAEKPFSTPSLTPSKCSFIRTSACRGLRIQSRVLVQFAVADCVVSAESVHSSPITKTSPINTPVFFVVVFDLVLAAKQRAAVFETNLHQASAALNAVYNGSGPSHKEADRWLQEFQRSQEAWSVSVSPRSPRRLRGKNDVDNLRCVVGASIDTWVNIMSARLSPPTIVPGLFTGRKQAHEGCDVNAHL